MPPLNKTLLTQNARIHYEGSQHAAPSNPFAARPGPIIGAHRAPVIPDLATAIAPLCEAICHAHDRWRQEARFDDIQIHGPTAMGGRLVAPALDEQIQAGMRLQGPGKVSREVVDAVATGLGAQWTRFTDSVRLPGLPWYPTFAAFAGPLAPPTPNVPMPLASCTLDRAAVSATAVEDAITRARGRPAGNETRLFKALAKAFAGAVEIWIPSQLIANALGTGPVPSFAPPASPVGPVVGGHVIAAPGHLAS